MNCSVALQRPAIDRPQRADSHFLRMLRPLPGFALVSEQSQPAYQEACEYIAKRFEREYKARLQHFMPHLMTMHCLKGLSGTVGMRPAVNNGSVKKLYLEHYLSQPVQQEISVAVSQAVTRNKVVEIGNLVASKRGVSQLLFLLMTRTLLEAGYEWVVFTATKTLRNTLDHLSFPYQCLASANPACLPDPERHAWGAYYASDPLVVAARLNAVSDIVARRPLLQQALRVYEGAIGHMSHQLSED